MVPFDINLTGGTLELETTRSTYEFAGKIWGTGTIDLKGPNPRTINEIEGAFNFKNSTASDSTVVIRKVNPGSRLRCSGGVVNEEGALPATASRATYGPDTYVFVPAEDGSLDTANLAHQNATTAFVPFGADVTLAAGDCHAKIGVTNNAVVNLTLDGGSVPTVVGGDGTIAVGAADWADDVGLWVDASQPYDTSTKGAPYYAPPGVNRSGYDFGNIFFTNNYPLVEAWYDVRGTERTWYFYNSRYYNNDQFTVFTHVYPYLAQDTIAGRTMSYVTFGVNGAAKSTWSNDGPDSPTVTSNMGGNRRLYMEGMTVNPTAVIMVFGWSRRANARRPRLPNRAVRHHDLAGRRRGGPHGRILQRRVAGRVDCRFCRSHGRCHRAAHQVSRRGRAELRRDPLFHQRRVGRQAAAG